MSKNVLYVCHKVKTFPVGTFSPGLSTSKMETGRPGKANEEAVWMRCQLMIYIHSNILVLVYFNIGSIFSGGITVLCILCYNSTSFLNAANQIEVQFSSVAQSYQILCDPINCSKPGLAVHHQLPEFTQTHVHQVGDAIQPSHLCHPLLLLPPIPPSIRVFSNESTLCMRWPKYWSFSFSISPSSEHPGLISFRKDSLEDSQESSPTPPFKSINSLVLSLLHSPTLTSIHDHWKNHSLD